MNYWKIKRRIKFRFNGDCVLEDDVDLILKRLKEYLKNIDGEEFKKIFLSYVEYMARNYGQDCLICEYDQIDYSHVKALVVADICTTSIA